MTRSRIARRDNGRGRRVKLAVAGIGVATILAGTAFAVFAATGQDENVDVPASVAQEAPLAADLTESTASAGFSAESSSTIEVPDVVGRTVKEAQLILSAAGLMLEIQADGTSVAPGAEQVVRSQDPAAGELVMTGSVVTGLVPAASQATPATQARGIVICIDPGHQSSSNLSPEPIGPGASQTKEKVRGGTTGVATGIPEYEVVLQISMNLKQRLEAEGITVVMTRTTNDVDISNAERAQIANGAGAELFIRVHADGSTDSSVAGISTLYPGANQWTGPIAEESMAAAGIVHDSVIASTGAVSRGTVARTDLSGFNWAEVPSILVECGFMSNPVEDRLLASPHYQDKVAQGIADGVLAYVGRQ